jgi:outer membrane protein assembly factor BamA
MVASAEYTVPLFSAVRLAGFYDIGGAWEEVWELDPDTLASGAGVGLRLDVPGFPIRIDRAWALEKDYDVTKEDDWVVWIGFDR